MSNKDPPPLDKGLVDNGDGLGDGGSGLVVRGGDLVVEDGSVSEIISVVPRGLDVKGRHVVATGSATNVFDVTVGHRLGGNLVSEEGLLDGEMLTEVGNEVVNAGCSVVTKVALSSVVVATFKPVDVGNFISGCVFSDGVVVFRFWEVDSNISNVVFKSSDTFVSDTSCVVMYDCTEASINPLECDADGDVFDAVVDSAGSVVVGRDVLEVLLETVVESEFVEVGLSPGLLPASLLPAIC